jgi:hypothetical protein
MSKSKKDIPVQAEDLGSFVTTRDGVQRWAWNAPHDTITIYDRVTRLAFDPSHEGSFLLEIASNPRRPRELRVRSCAVSENAIREHLAYDPKGATRIALAWLNRRYAVKVGPALSEWFAGGPVGDDDITRFEALSDDAKRWTNDRARQWSNGHNDKAQCWKRSLDECLDIVVSQPGG